MTKTIVHALRGISIAVFIGTLFWLLSIIVFHPWQPMTPGTLDPLPYPLTIGDPEINIWNAFVYFFMYAFGLIGHAFSGGMAAPPYDPTYFWDNFTVATYYFAFEICIIVAVVSMIMFLRKCNPEWSFRAFLFLIGMLILITLSQYAHYLSPAGFGIDILTLVWILGFSIFGLLLFKQAISSAFQKKSRSIFYFCFAAFIIPVSYTSAGLLDSIPSFYLDSLSNSVVNMNIGEFITNPIFLAAFFTFLFLEITYLTAYNYAVAQPSLQRENIINEQLQGLERLGQQSTETLKAKAELHSISIRRFFSSEAFDFMREVIEKGVYDKEAQARMASLRDFQHLQTYLEDLYTKDPEARASLTAKASLPEASKLARASLVGTGYRVLLVFLLILLCFSPFLFFDILAIVPGSIPYYLEIQTVSAVIVIAVPFILLFPTIGSILKMRRLPKIIEEEEAEKLEEETKVVAEKMGVA